VQNGRRITASPSTHAIDILDVLRQVNTTTSTCFLSAPARALSPWCEQPHRRGISLSSAVHPEVLPLPRQAVHQRAGLSPVCSRIRAPSRARVAEYQRPVRSHQPVDSQALFDNLTAAGVNAAIDAVSGGCPSRISRARRTRCCGALDFHGYMGIEPTAVGRITAWLTGGWRPWAKTGTRCRVRHGSQRRLEPRSRSIFPH